LLRKIQQKKKSRTFDKFVGILDKNFKTNDKRYNAIVRCSVYIVLSNIKNQDKEMR